MRTYQWAIAIAILSASPVVGGWTGGLGGLVGGAFVGAWIGVKDVSTAISVRPRDDY